MVMKDIVRAAISQNQDFSNQGSHFFVRVMRIGSTPVGAIGLAGDALTPFLSTAISSLCTISLEREKSLDREAQKSAEQRTEQLRMAVLDSLAHEYKTPLTVIRAAADGLLQMGHLSENQTNMVQIISDGTCRLDSLTTRLLRTSSLDSGELNLHLEAIDPEDLIATVVNEMHGALAGHAVRVILDHGNARLQADRELLNTALCQYLDNAAKYSDPESIITVAVAAHPPDIRMSVHNSGSYLPPSERDLVFDRFHRSETGSKGAPGSGIGLSVVYKVASAHQGRAWVSSDKDSGTTFFLAIPQLKELAVGVSDKID
jgi:two-component system sensor histidine kinase KdpD